MFEQQHSLAMIAALIDFSPSDALDESIENLAPSGLARVRHASLVPLLFSVLLPQWKEGPRHAPTSLLTGCLVLRLALLAVPSQLLVSLPVLWAPVHVLCVSLSLDPVSWFWVSTCTFI